MLFAYVVYCAVACCNYVGCDVICLCYVVRTWSGRKQLRLPIQCSMQALAAHVQSLYTHAFVADFRNLWCMVQLDILHVLGCS